MTDRPLSSRERVAIVAAASVMAAALAILLLALIPGSHQLPDLGWIFAVLLVAMGVGFFALGAVVWLRNPDNRTGLLMLIEGLVILVTGLQISSNPWLFIAGALTDALVISAFIHMLLAFPSGRLESRAARIVVWIVYAAALLQVPVVLFGSGPDLGCDAKHPCPDNPLLIEQHRTLSDVLESVQAIMLVGAALVTVFLLLRRYRRSGPLARRGLAPVLFVGATILILAIVQAVLRGTAAGPAAQGAFFIAFALLPVAFLVGLSRSRLLRGSTIAGLVDRLVSDPGAAGIDGALGGVLSDPTLFVAYRLDDGAGYVDRSGRAVQLPAADDGEGRVATEVAHDGRVVAAVVHDAALCQERELLRAAAGAAALAIENARLEAQLRARLAALRASRARLVEAGDRERRRLGRDLHDGAQQRLVSLMLELQIARETWERDPAMARGLVDQAFDNARAAVDELRRPSSPSAGSTPGSSRSRRAPRSRWSSGTRSRSAYLCRSRPRRTTWSPRRSRTSRSTPRRRTPGSTSAATTASSSSRSATTGRAGRIRRAGRACAAWPTASAPSTGGSRWRARRGRGRSCAR
jgi:signal transduction histidine kinase